MKEVEERCLAVEAQKKMASLKAAKPEAKPEPYHRLQGSSLVEFLGSSVPTERQSSSSSSENNFAKQYDLRNGVQNKATTIDKLKLGLLEQEKQVSNPNE